MNATIRPLWTEVERIAGPAFTVECDVIDRCPGLLSNYPSPTRRSYLFPKRFGVKPALREHVGRTSLY
jgi:hypothetical protein